MANKTTFWNFIKNNRIEIPIIQRDYAQGRVGKEYLRKSFLGDLKKALDNGEELKLDFVYGSIENVFFHPLDGQQRLTTLWLLHWYIALRAGLLYRACPILSKFSYETRISSREFCEKLCKPKNFESFSVDESIVDYITNQTWFYSTWKQDPTIQAMLRMLSGTQINDKNGDDIVDGIEEIFHSTRQPQFNNYWWILCSDKSPIKFYQLALNDFGLSDDLYIKMNARGKQLTAFESFKADLIDYLRKQDEAEQTVNNGWKVLLNPTDGIPILMDTIWTDVFWKNKSVGILYENGNIKNANKIDEIYFAFINRFFWNELFISKDYNNDYILDVGDGKLKDGTETRTIENFNPSYRHLNEDRYELYSDFSPYLYFKDNKEQEDELKRIPLSFFEGLKTVLGNFATYKDHIPICKWNKTFQFIPIYEKDEKQLNNIEIQNKDKEFVLKVSSLNQIQRIVFFAVCKYFKEGPADSVSLNRWMRVIWNLVSGEDEVGRPQIRNAEGMRKVIEFIDNIEDSHKVYECLKKITINDDSEFGSRCLEEVIKAGQILADNNQLRKYSGRCINNRGQILATWEEIIKEAEEHAFFNGSIRFLYLNAKGKVDWNNFDSKWENAKKYFDNDGVTKEFRKNTLLLRRFLSGIDKISKEMWFGNDSHYWHHVLLNHEYCPQMHDLLIQDNPVVCSKKDWIASDVLLGNVIKDNNKWHVLDNWRGYNVLTRYSNRQSGSVNNPNEIIVLDHRRNTIIYDMESPNRITNTNYFYGWNLIFKYRGFTFQWYGEPGAIYKDIYLMKNDKDYWMRNVDGIHEEEKFYCFNVANSETNESFKQRLIFLINDAVCK